MMPVTPSPSTAMNHPRRILFAFFASVAFASAALFAACGGDAPTVVTPPVDTTPPVPVVAAVGITGPTRLLTLHSDSVRATARTAAGVAITGKTVSWSSNNSAAVTVSAAGIVNGVAPGTATISATVDGIVGTSSIVVTDASLVTFTLTAPTSPVLVGASAQIATAGKDSVGQPVVIRSITWTSSNPNIATVSPTGLVTARAPGTVTIKAEGITNTAIISSVTVTVVPVPVASVVIANTDTLLRFRFPKQIVAMAKDSAGNVLQRPITYTTSDVDVSTLDPFGLATATGRGTVTITASSGGKIASMRFFVPPDSGLYVAALGGVPNDPISISFEIPNATSPATTSTTVGADGSTRVTFVTSPAATYRVRASTSAAPARAPAALSGIALLIGMANSGAVTTGPPSTVLTVPMNPYAATITAPATAAVNSQVTVTWTFDETTQPFSFFPNRAPTGRLYFSTTNGPDLSGTPVGASVTSDPTTGISTFSATFTAPATAGTIYIQVAGDGAVSQLLYPISFRGQALRAITVQ
jgi:uncharacterized protein YjdB